VRLLNYQAHWISVGAVAERWWQLVLASCDGMLNASMRGLCICRGGGRRNDNRSKMKWHNQASGITGAWRHNQLAVQYAGIIQL